MPSFSPIVRTLINSGRLVFFCLLFPGVISAAEASRFSGAHVCDPSAVTLRGLARIPKSFAGPQARPSREAQAWLSNASPRFKHPTRLAFDDDDVAIQDDAPAAWRDDEERVLEGLEPLGVLPRACISAPNTDTFSPKSLRGPPLAG